MKKRTKDLLVIIPLAVIALLIIISILTEIEEVDEDNKCQEGWFKYESEAGILCSKTELTQDELNDYFD